jgi:hypothetical protein
MAVIDVSNTLNLLPFTPFTTSGIMRLPGRFAPLAQLVDISAPAPVNTIGKFLLNNALDRCDWPMRHALSEHNTNLGHPKLTYRDRSKSP